ncbi:hypothetical protein Tsubulata_023325 [Turnera subulata]|uniref:PB1 domain-containing protein n=1 Tax=Turnera subulata TaxID=218843 RepID=A0A9Q0FJE8_9ROSI|nr:hypothetical protein Tsubulata_023325 [Turnera subulata]
MDPPPLPPLPTPSSAAASPHLNYPDYVDSSPRSHTTDTFHEPLPLVPGAKLRLMCSYDGHIIPRPHDKSLTYVGGETRMVAIDRHSSLPSLTSRLSRTLLNGRPFTLKYQLPDEELYSLISVTTDEDLENMIEEYDWITSSSSSSYLPTPVIKNALNLLVLLEYLDPTNLHQIYNGATLYQTTSDFGFVNITDPRAARSAGENAPRRRTKKVS